MSDTNPLSDLPDELKAKLQQLELSIGHENITVSFFLEDKDAFGRKKSAFNSHRVARTDGKTHWTSEEAKVVGCLLSKQIVVATYRDAVKRGFVAGETAKEEVTAIVRRYDQTIANMLKKGDASE